MSKQFPSPFSDMASRFRAYRRELPRIASKLAENHFRANFRRQGAFTGSGGSLEKWEPRRSGKDKGRAILVKSGRLRRALRSAPNFKYARVINNTPYAAIHNRGGALKGQAAAWSTNLRSGLIRRRQSNTPAAMPARPFMVTTEPLAKEISAEILAGLEDVFKGAKSA
jgi:phage gpG-like protein